MIDKQIKINHAKSFRYSNSKENEIDLKLKKIIKLLYSDSFNNILIYPRSQFIKNIEKKFDKIVSEKYPEYISIKKSFLDNLKKEINLKFNNEYQLLKKEIDEYIKNPNKYEFLTNFVPHCSKTEKVALHYCCSSSILGKFIQVDINDNNFVICVGCQKCFKGELIEMFCPFCQKHYYSSISSFNRNIIKTLPFATWEKYHCGSIVNEIMKCIKCKSNFYYDSINDKLVCLNKSCRFEAKPKRIIWKCSLCSADFTSSVKAFNPLEIKMFKNSINYALIMNEVARPFKINYCNFCRSDISKATFNHKKDCDGILLMSKLNNKEVIVCNKCHGMNFYSQYSWFCPFCNKKLKRKNFLSSNKGNINFYNKNNITYDKNVFSFDNEKSDKNHKNENKNNINIYNKNFFFRNTYVEKDIRKGVKQYNSQENEKFNLSNENNASLSNRNTLYSIKHLFLNNNSKEKYSKNQNSLSFNEKNKSNNSLGKSVNRKNTLFEILQHKNDITILSSSRDKKGSFYNNISANNFNINTDLDPSLKNLKKDKSNPKEIILKRFSLVEKNLRNNTDNNINLYNKQKYIRESDSNGTKRNIRNEFYNKNIVSNYSKLNEEHDQDNKAENKKQLYKSNRITNTIESHSFNKKENQIQKSNLIKYQNQLKEKIEKIKIDNNRFSANNKKYLKNKILEKNNYYTHDKNDNTNNTERFRTSCNNSTLNEYRKDFRKKRVNEPKKPYKFFYLEKNKNSKTKLIRNNTKPNNNLIEVKKSLFRLNISKNKEKMEENKKIQISLKRNVTENSFSPLYKSGSRRRYYQSINSKDKKPKKKITGNTIKLINEPMKRNNKLEINTDTNCTNNSTNIKKLKTIYSANTKALLTSNNNFNTNHTKNNETKDNVGEDDEDEDIKENNLIINVDDFDMNYDIDNDNILSDSKINSIINKELDDQVNSLYSPGKFEDIIKNCKIPEFDENDYIYKDSIGEGSFGTIFEVEEKKTGKKYAIKKIICKDMQELIQQKEQMELAYSIEHENIVKIIKIKIKRLDFTTYSINELMELAMSDWNQEILNRAKSKNYYKEKELINITKQIINGLLFLKSKNITHRDIKPQNILIFPNNVFKLADFGEAKFINNITSFRTLKGCELYMSPALYWGWIHGRSNLKHNIFKSDIFSFGYCLVYATTLNIFILQKIRKLNDNKSILNEINKCINKNIYSNKFMNIISKMIDLNEEQRYDIEDVFNEIENY